MLFFQALTGAKQVHVFDRTADETIGWIQEKDAAITTDNYGQDLESIQSLVRKHEGFQADLAAVKEQVFVFITLLIAIKIFIYVCVFMCVKLCM